MPTQSEERTYQYLDKIDFQEMIKFSIIELNRFTELVGRGRYEVYKNKILGICLCQGAALHYLDCLKNKQTKTGIKDIDIWLFFEEDDQIKIPDIKNCRKSIMANFTKLGQKRIDFMKKTVKKSIIEMANNVSSIEVIRAYLAISHTETAGFLANKAVIGLFPKEIFLKIIWPI